MSEANRQDCGYCLHSPCQCPAEMREEYDNEQPPECEHEYEFLEIDECGMEIHKCKKCGDINTPEAM